jgi:hypothetical protein
MVEGAASRGAVGELLLGVGSMWFVCVEASSVVGVRRLAPLAPSSVEWCHLDVMVVLSVVGGGAQMVL